MASIREEIRQTRPFPSVADEGLVTLLRTADTLRRALSVVAEPFGITLQQYNVLRILRGAGDAGLPTLEIVSRMIETSPGITRLLDRLERKRLVMRVRCPRDHRQILCFATDEARRTLARLDRPMTLAAERLLGPLGQSRIRDLIGLLDAARATAAGASRRSGSPAKARRPKDSRARKER